ncbi:hypothetical protein R1sor_007390 [Riccia sorocarpa]|uniref:Period n=1 Tax=Riccia sorocarpa TaxID=122646 RepID=A0ABD3HWM2_9MARC
MMKSKQDRDTVLSHVHAHIRNCTVAHMPWTPDMDVAGYVPKLKPTEVEPLPDSVFVTLAGCDYQCPLRKVEEIKSSQGGDSDQEEGHSSEHQSHREPTENIRCDGEYSDSLGLHQLKSSKSDDYPTQMTRQPS